MRKTAKTIGLIGALFLAGAGPTTLTPATRPSHAPLAAIETIAGEWKYEYEGSMGAGTLKGTGTATGAFVMGGNFLRLTHAGAVGRLNLESEMTLGYDPREKKYTCFGIDTLGTYAVSSKGDFEAGTKVLTLRGENEEPGLGKMAFKFVYTMVDADHFTMEIVFEIRGEWKRVGLLSYSRVK